MRLLRNRDAGLLASFAAAVFAVAAAAVVRAVRKVSRRMRRAQVERMHDLAFRSLTQNGYAAPPVVMEGGMAGVPAEAGRLAG